MSNLVWPAGKEQLEGELCRLLAASSKAWLVTPYVTKDAVKPLLACKGKDLKLMTRLNDEDILSGVLDPEALAELLDAGWKVRFHDRRLHAKLWLFDQVAMVGSANLTGLALSSNIELMVKSDAMVCSLADEFCDLWDALAEEQKTSSELRALAEQLRKHPARRWFEQAMASNGLRDYGGAKAPPPKKPGADSGSWLKINGLNADPMLLHWDLRPGYRMEGGQTFRRPGRPGLKERDAVILCYIGRKDGRPDRCIYGRGVVDRAHDPATDAAPKWLRKVIGNEEYQKAQIDRWPSIVWLRDLQMVNGTAEQCPWLSQINCKRTVIKPSSLRQQSHIRIGEDQAAALNDALDNAFSSVGCIYFERPEEIWWNKHIGNQRETVTRSRLESARQRSN